MLWTPSVQFRSNSQKTRFTLRARDVLHVALRTRHMHVRGGALQGQSSSISLSKRQSSRVSHLRRKPAEPRVSEVTERKTFGPWRRFLRRLGVLRLGEVMLLTLTQKVWRKKGQKFKPKSTLSSLNEWAARLQPQSGRNERKHILPDLQSDRHLVTKRSLRYSTEVTLKVLVVHPWC